MAPYVPKTGDYIVFQINDPAESSGFNKDKPKKSVYGQFISKTGSKIKYHPSEDATQEAEALVAAIDKGMAGVKKSSWAKMRMQAGPNFREAAENIALFGAYQGLIRKKQVMGAETVSFAIAEGAYELILKDFISQMMPSLLGPTKLDKNADAFFAMSDFSEPARRIIPLWALTQIVQRFMYKKQWGHEAISNLIGGYGALALSNIGDRMFMQDNGKYSYP